MDTRSPPPPVRGPVSLLLCPGLLGLGNACCQTAANVSMARALPAGRRSGWMPRLLGWLRGVRREPEVSSRAR